MKQVLKNILQIALAGILLISIIGLPVNNHYCNGSLIATTIGIANEDACGDMPMEGNCCDDTTTLYSLTDYFSNRDLALAHSNFIVLLLVCNYTQCIKPIPEISGYIAFTEHSPPLIESNIFMEIQSLLL